MVPPVTVATRDGVGTAPCPDTTDLKRYYSCLKIKTLSQDKFSHQNGLGVVIYNDKKRD